MMIFPFIQPNLNIEDGDLTEKEVPLAREWAWDFEKNEFALKNNKMYIVEKNEAIKIWIYKILKTERFKYLIYSHDYGNDLHWFIGETGTQAYIRAEIKRMVEEAILSTLGDYITELRKLEVSVDSDVVSINLAALTIYDLEVIIDALQIFR